MQLLLPTPNYCKSETKQENQKLQYKFYSRTFLLNCHLCKYFPDLLIWIEPVQYQTKNMHIANRYFVIKKVLVS